MMKLAALSVLGLFLAGAGAQAQTIVKISPDRKTVIATSEKGTATTHITRDANGVTLRTRYEPAKPSYQPMGGSSYQPMGVSGGYNSMGSGGYRPTGR